MGISVAGFGVRLLCGSKLDSPGGAGLNTGHAVNAFGIIEDRLTFLQGYTAPGTYPGAGTAGYTGIRYPVQREGIHGAGLFLPVHEVIISNFASLEIPTF